MSHYRVAVFANNPDEFDNLLAPYGENNEEYFEFCPISDDVRDWLKRIHDESFSDVEFERFLTEEGYVNSEIDGSLGCFRNPNAKWDWYTLDGGNWQFDLLPDQLYDNEGNSRKNQYRYRECGYNEEAARKDYARRVTIVDTGEDPEGTISVEEATDFLEDYPDEELYLLTREWIFPYAFVTPDGVWHSPGTVGWFACSDETPETLKKYIKEWAEYVQSKDNPYVSFVDCHI